jgi:hypothetical protein
MGSQFGGQGGQFVILGAWAVQRPHLCLEMVDNSCPQGVMIRLRDHDPRKWLPAR